VFLIDPLGWTEIDGAAYAPGFFVWNSEVGRRALGCQTFWFEAVCQNHIVWDATDVTEYTRKHTANVHEGLGEIRAMIEAIVAKRDARKDGFVSVVRKAMQTKLGDDAEEALKELCKNGIPRSVAKEAVTIAQEKGRFTIWSVVDALTRLSQESRYVGDRVETDQKAAQLLSLVA
jgi:histone H3/H4